MPSIPRSSDATVYVDSAVSGVTASGSATGRALYGLNGEHRGVLALLLGLLSMLSMLVAAALTLALGSGWWIPTIALSGVGLSLTGALAALCTNRGRELLAQVTQAVTRPR